MDSRKEKLSKFIGKALSNGRKTFIRVAVVLGIVLSGLYLGASSSSVLNHAANASYTGNGYILLGSDSGVFTYGQSNFYGNCYTVNCGFTPYSGALPFSAIDLHTGGYQLMNAGGGLYQFNGGFAGDGAAWGVGNPWSAIAYNYNDTGLYGIDDYGNVFTQGGAIYYGQAGNCSCYTDIIPLPMGGYEVLAYNGFMAGFGPGAYSIAPISGVSGIVSGAYDPYNGVIYVLDQNGDIYADGGTNIASQYGFATMGSPAAAIAIDNLGRVVATTKSGAVYAYSTGQSTPNNLGSITGSLNAPITQIGYLYETPSLYGASISNSNALSPGTITVNGNGFIDGDSTIYVNGSPIATTWQSGGTLTGTISSYTSAANLSIYVSSSWGNTGSTNIALTCPTPSLSWSGAGSAGINQTVSLTETVSNSCAPSVSNGSFTIGTNSASSYSLTSNPSTGVYTYSVTYPATSTTNVGSDNVSVNLGSAGSAAASSQFKYTFFNAAQLSPGAFPSGGTATFTGTNLNGGNQATFSASGGTTPYTTGVVNGSSTSVTFSGVPSAASLYGSSYYQASLPLNINWSLATTINGVVSTATGYESEAHLFSSLPTVTIPNIIGGGGNTVTVSGANLIGTSSVTFTNGSSSITEPLTLSSSTSGTISLPTATQLGVTSPNTTVSYTVSSDGYTGVSAGTTTFVSVLSSSSSLPTVTIPNITNGGGNTVTVSGANLVGASSVTFTNGSSSITEPLTLSSSTSGAISLPTATQLGVTSPNTTISYTVSSDGYTGVSAGTTTFVSVSGNLPTVTIPNITNGGGNTVTVSGANLVGTSSVTFTYGTNAPVTEPLTLSSSTSGTISLPTATQLGVTSPNTTISYTVSSDGYTGVSAGTTTFVSVSGSPAVSLVSPSAFGYDGGTLTLSGTNFAGASSIVLTGKSQVTIQAATSNSGSLTFLINSADLMAASGGSAGSLSISLTTDNYQAITAGSINFDLPAIFSISPSNLQFAGGQIIIAGNYLPSNATVTFTNGTSQVSVTATTANSNQITVTAPSSDQVGLNYPGAASVTVAPSSALGFVSSPYSITYQTTSHTKTSVLNLILSSGDLNVTTPHTNNNDITGEIDTVATGDLPLANWQDTTGLGDGWNGQIQVGSFVYTGQWIALNGTSPLSITSSSPYVGSQDGVTYVVTVTGANSATYQSNTNNDSSGSFTFTPGVASTFGSNGLSIVIPSGISSGKYEIHVGTQNQNSLSLDDSNPPAAISPSPGGAKPPIFQNPNAILTYGSSPIPNTYGPSVKFASAELYAGMGNFPIQPVGSIAIDANSWAASYTAQVQYSIVAGP